MNFNTTARDIDPNSNLSKYTVIRDTQVGGRARSYADTFAGGDINKIQFITKTEAEDLQSRNVQQEQTIKALKELLSTLPVQSQQPARESGMQTDRKHVCKLWTEDEKSKLRDLTGTQDNIGWIAYEKNNINWNTVKGSFTGRSINDLKSQYSKQKDDAQKQRIQALQQQIKPSEIQQQIQMLEAMLGSTLQGHTFKDGAKHNAAEFAVRTGWIWNQSGHTYEKRLDQQTLASGADKLYNELRNHNSDWFIN